MWYVFDLDTSKPVTEGVNNVEIAQALCDRAMKRIEASGGFYAPHMLVVRWIP